MARKFFKKMQNMENGVFAGVGKYNIPTLQGTKLEEFNSNTHWIDFHQTTKRAKTEKHTRYIFLWMIINLSGVGRL